ncbi:hypothetical protein [Actinoplanes regularis]|uniref:Uncharacterized protein n=1 Tax=Actinoplanes regularis TaxID=52697 RepID=A0A239C7Q2_9ACTN|nr:hypothetical protein [Actinoplanes regularis]GIE92301.1 hypothetical protein Are01nite_87810 [Actinoplanes regularis]SNS15969.1 hypothetical protein SAMN06264365_11119 [Actinoplanes regularis]
MLHLDSKPNGEQGGHHAVSGKDTSDLQWQENDSSKSGMAGRAAHRGEQPDHAKALDQAVRRDRRLGEQSGQARRTNRTTLSLTRTNRRCDASRQPRPSQDRHTPEEFAMC